MNIRAVGTLTFAAAAVSALAAAALHLAPVPALAAGSAPTLTGPANAARISGYGTALTWTNPPGATQYQLQVTPAKNDGPGVDVHIGAADSSFELPAPPSWYGLLPDMTYTWRVRTSTAAAYVGLEDASWGPWAEATFRTPAPTAGTITAATSVNGATGVATTPLLRWADSNAAIYYYELQVSRDGTFNTNAATATAPVYSALVHGGASDLKNSFAWPTNVPLDAGVTYYWRIRPRVQGDGTPVGWSTRFSFTTAGAAATTPAPSAGTSTIDKTKLPIGDGKVSSTTPAKGSLYSCTSTFNGGGAFKDGPWIKSDGTWDLTQKTSVSGSVKWPSQFTITTQGSQRVLTGNDLPSHATGTYPIASSDAAYQYDRNPNRISSQTMTVTIPANPTLAAKPTCLGMGAIGVMLTGTVFYNAVDALGRDAGAHEIQDACGGHPDQSSSYHYHSLSECAEDPGTGHSALVGYALDGFGIYGHRGENGEVLTDADLDECHGHTHEITWDGQKVVMYHYHATYEYPYTVSCYRGTPGTTTMPGSGSGPTGGQGGQGGQRPPQR